MILRNIYFKQSQNILALSDGGSESGLSVVDVSDGSHVQMGLHSLEVFLASGHGKASHVRLDDRATREAAHKL